MIDGDEPLLGGPEDHRLLAPPAMRIAVRERLLVEEVARFSAAARRSTGLAAKTCWPVSQSGARAVNRPDSSTGLKTGSSIGPAGLVVLGTMPGRGMHQPGAVLDADVLGQHDRADAVDERVTIFRMLRAPCRGTGRLR